MRVKIVMQEDQCQECHGALVFSVDCGATGSSAGQTIDHAANCPTNYCEHGKRVTAQSMGLIEECETCEAVREAEALLYCDHDFEGNDYNKPCARCGRMVLEDGEDK